MKTHRPSVNVRILPGLYMFRDVTVAKSKKAMPARTLRMSSIRLRMPSMVTALTRRYIRSIRIGRIMPFSSFSYSIGI